MSEPYCDQQRIDAICWKIHDYVLLKDEDIHRLAYNWGDIEHAAIEHAKTLDKLQAALVSFEENPSECRQELASLITCYDEFRYHADSAAVLISAIRDEIELRHPRSVPEEEGDEGNSQVSGD